MQFVIAAACAASLVLALLMLVKRRHHRRELAEMEYARDRAYDVGWSDRYETPEGWTVTESVGPFQQGWTREILMPEAPADLVMRQYGIEGEPPPRLSNELLPGPLKGWFVHASDTDEASRFLIRLASKGVLNRDGPFELEFRERTLYQRGPGTGIPAGPFQRQYEWGPSAELIAELEAGVRANKE